VNWKLTKPLAIDWSLVKRELDALDANDRQRVVAHVERFARQGVGDVAKLVGSNPAEWRLKFKPWRVIFAIDTGGSMRVLSVVQRKDAYR
jgi:mRNA-degrading endonuclease RelE of RelBE toxin-antitoxin system